MPRGLMLEAGSRLPATDRRACVSDVEPGAVDAPDVGTLSVAIELADHALCGSSLARSAYAALVSDLYAGVRMRMPYRELLDFARATVACAARDAGELREPRG